MTIAIAVVLIVAGLFLMNQVMRRVNSRIVRFAILVPILTVFGVVGVLVFQMGGPTSAAGTEIEAQIIDRTVAERGTLNVTVNATGAIVPEREASLAFETSASVVEIMVDEGQTVSEGDVLARLDAIDQDLILESARVNYEQQRIAYNDLVSPARDVDIAAAEQAVLAAQASAGAAYSSGPDANDERIAELEIELARNRLWQTQINRDETERSTGNAVNRATLGALQDDAETARTADLARLNLLQANTSVLQGEQNIILEEAQYNTVLSDGIDYASLGSANAERVRAQIALDDLLNGPEPLNRRRSEISLRLAELALQQVQYDLQQTELTAPFAGVIAESNLTVGENPPQGPAMVLMDTSQYYVDLPIDETDVVKMSVGQAVSFDVDALPGADVSGEVVRVAYTPQIEGQLVTYEARVRINPTDAPIRVGMSVTADISVERREDVILLPNRFIRIDRTTQDAFVTIQNDDGTFEETLVTLGERDDIFSEIVIGLEEGQNVVLLPRETFSERQLGGG